MIKYAITLVLLFELVLIFRVERLELTTEFPPSQEQVLSIEDALFLIERRISCVERMNILMHHECSSLTGLSSLVEKRGVIDTLIILKTLSSLKINNEIALQALYTYKKIKIIIRASIELDAETMNFTSENTKDLWKTSHIKLISHLDEKCSGITGTTKKQLDFPNLKILEQYSSQNYIRYVKSNYCHIIKPLIYKKQNSISEKSLTHRK